MSKQRVKLINPVLLGQGGLATVYRLMEEHTGNFVVCKVSEQKTLIEREGKMLNKIKHSLFPRYKGIQTYGNRACLMMEYIEGMSLEVYVKRRGGLSEKRTAGIARELAEGLCYLHEQSEKVIYRDIKPENVLIQSNGKVRLVDLGCVYVEGQAGCGLAGSKGYAAPEQFDIQKKVGEESDVYGLGKLMYFMLTGCNVLERFGKELHYPPEKRISRSMKMLIGHAIQENQHCRIPDMRTFLQYIELYEEGTLRKRFFCGRRKGTEKMGKSMFYFRENIRKGR